MKKVFSKTVLSLTFVHAIILISSNTIWAQDNIILRNNDVIKAKVDEVGLDIVKYHKSENLDGPVYDIAKADIYMIIYANGSKDVMNEPATGTDADKYNSAEDNQPAPNVQPAQQENEVTEQTFYDQLSPYGSWMNSPSYGYVWVPNVGADFRPYGTAGHWAYTEYGWTWVSDFPWGWAAFHYGRWFYEPEIGYVWAPDTQWGPAWVSWRRSEGYYGWVPLGPRGYEFPQDHWCFVHAEYITNQRIYDHYERHENIVVIYNQTTVIQNNYVERGGVRYVAGPDRVEVEHVTHNTVAQQRIVSRNTPGQTVHERDEISIYRPTIHASVNTTAKPVEVTSREKILPPAQRTTVVHPVINNNHNTSEPVNNNRTEPVNNNRPEPAINNNRNLPGNNNRTEPANNNRTEPTINNNRNVPANNNRTEPANNNRTEPANNNRSKPVTPNHNNTVPAQPRTEPNNNNSNNRTEPAKINRTNTEPVQRSEPAAPHNRNNTRPAQTPSKPVQPQVKPATKPAPNTRTVPIEHKK